MKSFKVALLLALFFISTQSFSQDVVGTWKTLDEKTGKPASYIKVYKNKNGVVFGRIVKILDPQKRNKRCDKCDTKSNGFAKKGDKIEGMLILRGLTKDGNEYNGGQIFSPRTNKIYKCYIKLENRNKLKVRGYMGSRYMGGTRYWYRLN
ncbi:MAG TPA: DUF2147 domain-containing protein [Microscillaceae bacterium]|nr:DUF2147 domain-containing protein [Microscillaceae bacterium]